MENSKEKLLYRPYVSFSHCKCDSYENSKCDNKPFINNLRLKILIKETIKEISEEKPDYIDWLINNSKDDYLAKVIELETGKKKLNEDELKQFTDLQVRLLKLMKEAEEKTDFNREDLYDHYGTMNLNLDQTKEAIAILETKLGE